MTEGAPHRRPAVRTEEDGRGGLRLIFHSVVSSTPETVTARYRPGIEIEPLHEPLRTGDPSRRLRVLSAAMTGDLDLGREGADGAVYTARLQGRRGQAYRARLRVPFRVRSIQGAREIRTAGNHRELEVLIPAGDGDWGTVELRVNLAGR